MFRIIFSTLLLAGVYQSVNAQRNNTDKDAAGTLSLKSASVIVGSLHPLSAETTFLGSGPYYKFGLDLSSTKAVMPDIIHPESSWSVQGKGTQKAVNFETIDYAENHGRQVPFNQELNGNVAVKAIAGPRPLLA